jgi:hypothetical protein
MSSRIALSTVGRPPYRPLPYPPISPIATACERLRYATCNGIKLSLMLVVCTFAERGDEIRALRKLQRENPPRGAYVFISERGGPMSTLGFHHLIERLGKAAKLPFAVHPHMLRHACGFKLANDGHDTRALQHYLGHKNIQHTVCYTELSPDRFRDFWRD